MFEAHSKKFLCATLPKAGEQFGAVREIVSKNTEQLNKLAHRSGRFCLLLPQYKSEAGLGMQSPLNIMKILLVNPPIYDFAAYNLWSAPIGLLYLAAILKNNNIEFEILDYLQTPPETIYGDGHYIKQRVEKPAAIKHIPRYYSRYGLPRDSAVKWLNEKCRPDLIIMTSVMTYWYPGVWEAVKTCKEIFPKTEIALGGIYAALCPEHAKKSGADFIISGDLQNLNPLLKAKTGLEPIPCNFSAFPAPLYPQNWNSGFVSLRFLMGCPCDCSYCAQKFLTDGKLNAKTPDQIFNEISFYASKGIKNFAFYDDALLYDSDNLLKPLLRKIISENLKIYFHTPNGLHSAYLDQELAALMKQAGFIMPRFSLETSNADLQKETGGKITNFRFEQTVRYLNNAGFKRGEYIAYLLMGMPGQTLKDIENSIYYANSLGAKISISEYSFIPKTKDFERQCERWKVESGINGTNIVNEPLLHNPSVFPPYEIKDWQEISRIKNLAVELNKQLVVSRET